MIFRATRQGARRNGARGSRASSWRARRRRSASSCSLIFKPSARTTLEGRPVSYPGSPAIAQTLMRAQDRIALCEANADERGALIAALGRDGRLSIAGADGYVALNAYLPPKERRGIVLIDPPFEAPDEAGAVVRALERALRKWPTGLTSRGGRSATLEATPVFSTRSPRSARQTSCGSNLILALGRPARMARSR